MLVSYRAAVVSTVIVATVPSLIWAHESRLPRERDISSDWVDWRRKFLQRIISSVVDWRRKPRAIRISSVVVDCLLFGSPHGPLAHETPGRRGARWSAPLSTRR